MPNNKQKGNNGEKIATNHLLKNGYEILAKNWRSGHLELDIVAFINQTLVIAEVKYRTRESPENPRELVSLKKQKNLIKAADAYIKENNLDFETRFDVIIIVGEVNKTRLEHVEGAFISTP